MIIANPKPAKKILLEAPYDLKPELNRLKEGIFQALEGRTIQPGDHLFLGDLHLLVKETKPLGAVTVESGTTLKLVPRVQPMLITCKKCGHLQPTLGHECYDCGCELPVCTLK